MDKNVFRFIWRHSRRQQILVLIATAVSWPFLYLSLDLPKIIVNQAIDGGAEFPVALLGLTLDQVEYLLVLSFIFLALVCINGVFKYYINIYRGMVGEQLLRRLRFELYERVLRFRLPRFRRMSSGEIIPMVTQEVEPIGGFGGDAYALPAFQGGQLLVYLGFILVQDPVLGAAAIALYPVQAYIIPKLQRRVNELGKQRVRTVRHLSDRVGETVINAQEIHANDTSQYHFADVTNRLAIIYDIRLEIFKRKFFIKFLNNFLNQLTPFFFYAIGGYLVIKGELSFGALVAVLAAYKDLSGPWRELLNYYQRVEDIRIKYGQVVEQFEPEDLIPREQLSDDPPIDEPLPRRLTLTNLTVSDDNDVPLVNGISASIDLDQHVALLGTAGSGRDELALAVARLLPPASGSIAYGDLDLADLPESITGRRIGYVGPQSFLFSSTLRENLYYGLKHRPIIDPLYDADARKQRRRRIQEATFTGNSLYDINADWVDFAAVGAESQSALEGRALTLLETVDLERDVYRMGLGNTLDPQRYSDATTKLLAARAALHDRLQAAENADLVELFDSQTFNTSATVAENLLFGTPVGPAFQIGGLADNPHILTVLREEGLLDVFVEIGAGVAETMIELFADLPPGHEFFDQYSFIAAEELPDFQPLVAKVGRDGIGALKPDERRRLMALPFKLIPTRHRLGLLDDTLQQRLLSARSRFARTLPPEMAANIEFYDSARYNAAASIQDNLLFGKISYGLSGAEEKVQALIAAVVEEVDLRRTIVAVGLDSSVGVAGGRLSQAQRQKLALARVLMKRPDVLILNDATSALDGGTHARIMATVREAYGEGGLIFGTSRPTLARDFDELIVMRNGRIAERGGFRQLDDTGSALRELIEAE